MAVNNLSSPLQLVKKSNALCRASWGPKNVLEPRLVALLASKIRKDDKDFKVYEIHVSEVLGERHSGQDYHDIGQVVDNIMSRVITIYDHDGWTKYNVFSRCRFRRRDGILELGFHPDLIPHYLQLKEKFAKYRLDEFFALPSTYSQRIYEILRSWDDQPDVLISIEDLHLMLNVPESLIKDFTNFRRRVLEKAHKDIHQHTSLKFEWEPVNKGRKVVAVRFVFSPRRQQDVEKKQRTQNSQQNNKRFLAAARCKGDHPNGCERTNKPSVCALCDDLLSE